MRRFARRAVALVLGVGLGVAVAPSAAVANHENEGDCKSGSGYYTQQASLNEPSQYGRNGVKATINRIAPDPAPKTAIIRSIYLFDSNGVDMVEFGWGYGNSATYMPPGITTTDSYIAFAARQLGSQYVASEGDPDNPGHGTVSQGEHPFRIEQNTNGSEPNTFFFYRDGDYFGRYYNPNLSTGGNPVGGIEAKGPCDSMSAHFSDLKRLNSVGGNWSDWTSVGRSAFPDQNTKWWYSDKTDNPPEYWMKHCGSAWCSNQ